MTNQSKKKKRRNRKVNKTSATKSESTGFVITVDAPVLETKKEETSNKTKETSK